MAPPDPLADWVPQEVEGRLGARNFRWGFLVVLLLLVAGAGGVGYWLYQRPLVEAEASLTELTRAATRLGSALPDLERINGSLTGDAPADSSVLFAVERVARSLFDASSSVPAEETTTRSAAVAAAGTTLEAIKVLGDSFAYRAAVKPVLVPPQLETDPELIALDEAARSFGAWQLEFDDVRAILPSGVLSPATREMEILSADLSGIMGRYVDALREDDMAAAKAVTDEMTARLESIASTLETELGVTQKQVTDRIAEVSQALQRLESS